MSKGRFIVFEGIDGAGKSTQVALLTKKLNELGCDVYLTAEPTELESGKALRRALSGEDKKSECEMAAMFVLDRIAHNTDPENGIIALTEQGKTVISDRYYYSTLAYQGHTTNYQWVKDMNLLCPEIKHPDICIYLDLLPEQSLERIKARNEKTEIYENLQKLTSVRNTFLSVINDLKAGGEKIFIINADRTPDEIGNEIFDIIRENLFN